MARCRWRVKVTLEAAFQAIAEVDAVLEEVAMVLQLPCHI